MGLAEANSGHNCSPPKLVVSSSTASAIITMEQSNSVLPEDTAWVTRIIRELAARKTFNELPATRMCAHDAGR